MDPYFTPSNTTPRYELRYHFGWYAYRRQPLFADPKLASLLTAALADVSSRYEYHNLETEVDPFALRTLLSLRPEMSPSSVTRIVKGNLSTAVRKQLGMTDLWSRGWFMRSNGHVTNDTIRKYIAAQYDHHQAAPLSHPEEAAIAKWHDPGDSSQMRTITHAALEYNVHFVLVTRRRFEFLDLQVAQYLIDYWRRVCDKKKWRAWDIEVVWNHAHLFLGLHPTDAPGEVALGLMNNSAWMLEQRYGAAVQQEKMAGIWQPSYYVGTAGSATTAQVKSYLRRVRGE